ncbi:MAG TPA: glycosyltransferase [Opitutaceae bacterium]|nr:glycosyltransferase [Opitutaceae bacterium]
MSTAPLITVAICTYNRAELLGQTLRDIARQEFPRDRYEVLVVDNNSRDNTRDVVAGFASVQPAPRHLFETQQGLPHARNRAIAEARGEIIVFADDDVLLEPNWLGQLIAPFAADSTRRVGVVGGEVIPVFPNGLPPWVEEWHSPLAFRHDAGPLTPRQSPMGANLAFRREVFAQLGNFATGLGRAGKNLFAGEESEMIRRARAAGFEVWFAPQAVAKHQMPASRTTFAYATRHAFDSARSRVIERANQGHAAGYFVSRFLGNFFKAPCLALFALLAALVLRTGDAKKALVRAWRSCGYLYQIPRSLIGKL